MYLAETIAAVSDIDTERRVTEMTWITKHKFVCWAFKDNRRETEQRPEASVRSSHDIRWTHNSRRNSCSAFVPNPEITTCSASTLQLKLGFYQHLFSVQFIVNGWSSHHQFIIDFVLYEGCCQQPFLIQFEQLISHFLLFTADYDHCGSSVWGVGTASQWPDSKMQSGHCSKHWYVGGLVTPQLWSNWNDFLSLPKDHSRLKWPAVSLWGCLLYFSINWGIRAPVGQQ